MKPRGKILAVKLGYNPNSSSLGVDVTFLLFGMAIITILTPVFELLLRLFSLKPGRLPAAVRRKCEDLLIDVVGLCVTARREPYVASALASIEVSGSIRCTHPPLTSAGKIAVFPRSVLISETTANWVPSPAPSRSRSAAV